MTYVPQPYSKLLPQIWMSPSVFPDRALLVHFGCLTKMNLHHYLDTTHQRSCGKVMFSVTCVHRVACDHYPCYIGPQKTGPPDLGTNSPWTWDLTVQETPSTPRDWTQIPSSGRPCKWHMVEFIGGILSCYAINLQISLQFICVFVH